MQRMSVRDVVASRGFFVFGLLRYQYPQWRMYCLFFRRDVYGGIV